MKYFALLVLALACSSARAWDDGGHMLVAQIAYSQLNADAKKQADSLLKYLPDERVSTPRSKPRAYDFVSAACWMDDVRSVKKYDSYRSEHYINVPCGGDARKVKTPNALGAIEYSSRVLKSNQFGSQSKARALAILLHVIGDIHQPLHSIDKDLGGNTFPLAGVPGIAPRIRRDGKPIDKSKPATGDNAPLYQRLHALWDSAYRYDVVRNEGKKAAAQLYYLGNSSRPHSKRTAEVAADLTAHYLASDSKLLDENNVAQWIKESNAIACEFAFDTPRKRRPSQEYFEKAHDESCRRLALAGHRLATLLNALLASSS